MQSPERPAPYADIRMGEAEFRELADNAPVMIWRSRPDKLCDWFNKPWEDFVGRSQEQLFGYGWAEDVHPDDFDRCVATYTAAFDARERFTMPYRLRRRDGVYRWFLDNGAPFYRNGEFAGYFGSCVDITEQHELEDHQRVLLAELNHRVKNNLQLILSFLQLSKARAQGDEARELLQTAISRIQGVGAVQDQLHRNTGGQVDLGSYLPTLARTVLDAEGRTDMTLVAQTQSVAVSFQMASDLGLIVNELITNIVKHGGGDRVQLEVGRDDDGRARLVVRDSGAGFAPALLNEPAPGGGLRGLGLVSALAGRCGAQLIRENRDGACVTLRFTPDLERN